MKDKSTDKVSCQRRCNYCGSEAPVIWVHGHGQCAACGINVKECCTGDQKTDRVTQKSAPTT